MIVERGEAFAVRVYRGKHRGYEWVGTFKFKDYGGKRGARKTARVAEAEARGSGSGPATRATMKIGDYVTRYLEEYEETKKDSSYVTVTAQLSGFVRDFGDRTLADDSISRREAIAWAHDNRWRVPAVVALMNRAIEDEELTRNAFARLSRKGRGRKDKVPLSESELQQLGNLALRVHRDHGPIVRALILLPATPACARASSSGSSGTTSTSSECESGSAAASTRAGRRSRRTTRSARSS